MKSSLIIVLILGIMAVLSGVISDLRSIKTDVSATQTAVQEPMLCGTPRIGLHYVDHYRVDKEYVIDLTHGGVWSVWICRAFRGEQSE